VAEFARVEADLTGAETMTDVAAGIETALAAALAAVQAPKLVARVTLTGEMPLADALRRDDDLSRAEAQQAAEAVGNTLIDKVTFAFGGRSHSQTGPLAELEALMRTPKSLPAEVIDKTVEAMNAVRRALPRASHDTFPLSDEDRRAMAAQLISEGAEDVAARLRGAEDG